MIRVNRRFDTELVTGKQPKTEARRSEIEVAHGDCRNGIYAKMPMPIGSFISARPGLI
jgi:hypothetical protein